MSSTGASHSPGLPSIAADGRGRSIVAIVALAIGQALAAAVAAFATRDAFAALHAGSVALPVIALALIALAGIALAVLRGAEQVVAERVGQRYVGALRVVLFEHLAQMPQREVSRRRSGGLALRFIGDLDAVRRWVSLGIARLVSAAVVLPAALAVMFALQPTLALAAAPPIAIALGWMALAGMRLGPAHRRLRARRARLASDMLERVPHAPELRLLGRLHLETAQLRRRTDALIEAAVAQRRSAALLRSLPDAASGIAAAGVLLAAFVGAVAPAAAAGALAALGLAIHPLRDLAGVWDRHRAWVVARGKCRRVLAAHTVVRRSDPRRPRRGSAPPAVEVAQPAARLLRRLSVPAGRKVAIVGANGAGKSTLLRLAAGLEHAAHSQFTLDGVASADLSAAERRRTVSMMSSHSPILAGSLRRALTMGSAERPNDARITACAQAFGLAEVLRRVGGLDGALAEGGRNLSSGEVRRVLLTRVALSRAGLLLLDEPDDALDAGGAALVEALVRSTAATVLITTHDLALARRMDEMWFVARGSVVEAGAPDALLQRDGPAARHFRLRSVPSMHTQA